MSTSTKALLTMRPNVRGSLQDTKCPPPVTHHVGLPSSKESRGTRGSFTTVPPTGPSPVGPETPRLRPAASSSPFLEVFGRFA